MYTAPCLRSSHSTIDLDPICRTLSLVVVYIHMSCLFVCPSKQVTPAIDGHISKQFNALSKSHLLDSLTMTILVDKI